MNEAKKTELKNQQENISLQLYCSSLQKLVNSSLTMGDFFKRKMQGYDGSFFGIRLG